MTVSRLASRERYKGHDRVIRTLPRVLQQHPDTIYLIVGDGDDRPRLESLAVECGVAKNVQFAGLVPPEELPDYFRLADVFVHAEHGRRIRHRLPRSDGYRHPRDRRKPRRKSRRLM